MATAAQTAHYKKQFLEHFAFYGNVLRAAQMAGVERRRVYDWLERDEDFATAYRFAELSATETLEAEAWRRAHDGVTSQKGVYHDGELIGSELKTEYSDTLLIFLLKARAPEKYRERYDLTTQGQPMIREAKQVDADLSAVV